MPNSPVVGHNVPKMLKILWSDVRRLKLPLFVAINDTECAASWTAARGDEITDARQARGSTDDAQLEIFRVPLQPFAPRNEGRFLFRILLASLKARGDGNTRKSKRLHQLLEPSREQVD